MDCNLTELIGKVLVKITGEKGDDEMVFICADGEKYRLYHDQDCCESVTIEDIAGDLNDLLNSPIIMSECVDGQTPQMESDEGTWSFYKFATQKGYVTIRWYGISNGYYSESVDFEKIIPPDIVKPMTFYFLTSTEILAAYIGNGVPINTIRHMVYETGKRRAIMKGITGGVAISKWAGEQVQDVDNQIDSLIAEDDKV